MDRDQIAGRAATRSCVHGIDIRSERRATIRQRGAAIVETIIALPVLLVVILGAIQFGLIYQAKATLNHASLQAARSGAVSNASAASIRQGLARGLLPLYSPQSSLDGVATTLLEINAQLATDARIRILNPTREAFDDFAEEVDGQREIPNDRLHVRSTTAGNRSALNVQDANVLKVQVTYGYELKVPLVNWFISSLLSQVSRGADAFEQQLLRRTRLPIIASATVRMQSPARMSDLIVARSELPNVERFDVNSRPADGSESGQHDGEAEDGQASESSERGGSTLGDGFFGFGGGHAQPVTSTADETSTSQENEEPAQTNSGNGSATSQEPEKPLCTPVETDSNDDAETKSLLGKYWDELKSLAGEAWDFVRGFIKGIEGQVADLIKTVTDPVGTVKGIYELAKAFIADPPGTIKTLAEALGQDLKQLIYCGSYDRGRVIGANVSPAFMLKALAKLTRFNGPELARILRETKRDVGCASFGAGTLVRTPEGLLPIERIDTGRIVLSRDETTFLEVSHRVTNVFTRVAPTHVVLVVEDAVFLVTEEHPLWKQGAGWKSVKDISEGDVIATASGDARVIKRQDVRSPIKVYNFSVDRTPSYFVGDKGLWVHNSFCSIWDMNPLIRGRMIEEYLSHTEYKAWQRTDTLINPKTGLPFRSRNFPLVDFQLNDVVVSLKSVNTKGKSWAKDMRDHIEDLRRAEITIDGKTASKVLDIRVQPGGLSDSRWLVEYGARQGITVTINEMKM